MKPLSFQLAAAAAVAVFFSGMPLRAATQVVWDGDTSTTFLTPANWVGDVAPVPDLSTSVAVFTSTLPNGTTTFQPTLTADRNINGLLFQSPSGGWTLGGTSTMSIGGGGFDDSANTSGTTTINANVSYGSSQSWLVGVGGNLVLNGLTKVTNNSRTITVNGGTVTIAQFDALSSANQIAFTGNGTVIINAAAASANVAGPVFIQGTATLVFGNKAAIGTGNVTMANTGTTLKAGVDLSAGNAVANNFIGDTFTVAGSNNLTLSGTFTNSAAGTLTNSLDIGKTLVLFGNFGLAEGGTARTQTITGAGNTTISGAITNFVTSGTAVGSLAKTGSGTLTLSGGNNTYTGTTSVGANGGTLQVATQNSLYNNTTASWTAANIRVASGGTLAFNVGGTGEFTTGNVTMLLGNLAASTNATTNGMAAGSTLGFDTTNASGSTFTIADVLANTTGTAGGARGLTKLGAGALVLSNSNTYTGATTVSVGTLLVGDTVGSTASLASGSTVSVSANGTLGGHGTIGGAATITDGKLAPGASAGSLEFGGNLSLVASTGTPQTQIELGGTSFTLNVTEQYDRIKLTGATPTLTLAGTLSVSLINAFTLSDNQAFGIFQLNPGATRTTTFSGLPTDGSLVGTFGGKNLYITYSANFGDSEAIALTGGNDIALYTVPEPATWGLLAFSLTTVVILRRRRKFN